MTTIAHHFSGGIYAKQMLIPAGFRVGKHTHDYGHLSILAKGHVEVEVHGLVTRYDAPACITIPAETPHTIRALSDSVWFCIHATSETDPLLVDKVIIHKEK